MKSAFNKNRLDARNYFLLIRYYELSLINLNNKNILKKDKKYFDSRINIYMSNSYINYM